MSSLTRDRINQVCDVLLADVSNHPGKLYSAEVNEIRFLALRALPAGEVVASVAQARQYVPPLGPQLDSIPQEVQEWIWHMDLHLTEHDDRHAGLALRAAWPTVRNWIAELKGDYISLRNQLKASPAPVAAEPVSEELSRLREIEHRVWHLLDASCEDSNTELTIDLEVAGDDYRKLLDLMPEAHPAPVNESPVDSQTSEPFRWIVEYPNGRCMYLTHYEYLYHDGYRDGPTKDTPLYTRDALANASISQKGTK